KLIDEVIGQLTKIKESGERDLGLRFIRTVFKLLAKLGVHGAVFQTGTLTYKDNEEEITKTFIFSGAYQLKEDDQIYFSGLPKGIFDAVVIGEVGKVND